MNRRHGIGKHRADACRPVRHHMTPEDVVKQFTSVKKWDYNDKSWINDYDHDDEEDEN